MENEVKVETKKKGNGLFTLFACVMTGIIVFLATNIGQKASKTVDPDTPSKNTSSNVTSNIESNITSNVESNVTSNVLSNSNVVSNTTSNVVSNKQSNTTSNTVPAKLSSGEALSTAKKLYNKAEDDYQVFMGMGLEKKCKRASSDGKKYDCTSLYKQMKTYFINDNKTNSMTGSTYRNIFNNFTAKNGKYYVTVGGIGFMGDCTTTLTVKSITATKIVFNAKTKIVYPTGYGEPNSTENHDFIIVKENGTWKISKYTYIIANTLK